MRNLIITLVGVLSLIGCKKDNDQTIVHTVKEIGFNAGHRYSNSFQGCRTTDLIWKGYFTADCLYELDNNHQQINKLIGLSADINPHNNSVRIGWSGDYGDGLIHLFMYQYVRGQRVESHLISVEPGQEFSVEIDRNTVFVYCGGGNFVTVVHSADLRGGKPWVLSPWFGGTEKASGNATIVTKYTNF